MDKQIEQRRPARKLRVLIVEDDLMTRQAHVDNVQRWGFESIVAEGVGDDLLQNASLLARQRRCHLALVDKQLRGSYNPGDVSGLDLIEKLKPTVTILVTGFADYDSTEAAHQSGVFAVVAKRNGPNAVKEALQKAARMWCPNVQVLWPHNWSAQEIVQAIGKENADGSEIEDIIRRLFPNAQRVSLSPLHLSTIKNEFVDRKSSVVILATEDDAVPVIVKLMRKELTARETSNYQKYITGRLGEIRYASQLGSEQLWNLGGIAYALIGSENKASRTFAEYYMSCSDYSQVLAPLRDHFSTAWKVHFDRREEMRKPLFDDYFSRLIKSGGGNHPSDIGSDMFLSLFANWNTYFAEPMFSNLAANLPNPVLWTYEHRANSGTLRGTTQCVIHGNLRVDDLLVDELGLSWVVDFEETGFGHILRDFVSLEIDILTLTLTDQSIALRDCYEMWVLLLKSRQPAQPDPCEYTHRIAKNPNLLKGYEVITQLHRLAAEVTGYSDRREFLWGLLLECMKRLMDDKLTARAAEILLLLSGMICHRLESWNDSDWPPDDWSPVTVKSLSEAIKIAATEEQERLVA